MGFSKSSLFLWPWSSFYSFRSCISPTIFHVCSTSWGNCSDFSCLELGQLFRGKGSKIKIDFHKKGMLQPLNAALRKLYWRSIYALQSSLNSEIQSYWECSTKLSFFISFHLVKLQQNSGKTHERRVAVVDRIWQKRLMKISWFWYVRHQQPLNTLQEAYCKDYEHFFSCCSHTVWLKVWLLPQKVTIQLFNWHQHLDDANDEALVKRVLYSCRRKRNFLCGESYCGK